VWRIAGNIVEMFTYAAVYLIISLVAMKIVAASLSSETEKQISDNNIAIGLVFAAVFVGVAIVISTVIQR
jgi:uncharacterized membrane protein YjfL (UPF0719 family)